LVIAPASAIIRRSDRGTAVEERKGIDKGNIAAPLHDLCDFVLDLREKTARQRHRSIGRETTPAGSKVSCGEEESTNLHVLERVLLRDAPQDVLFAALLQLPCQQELVQNIVGLCEGKDDVELANVAVVFVHLLDVSVDDLERDQLVVLGGATGDEEQRGISAINDLGVCNELASQQDVK
jgi:hypothetical protein